MEKNSKSCRDLDLGPAMPNIELVRDIFIYNDILKFHRSKTRKRGNMETQKHGNTETHTDSEEYSIVVFCKNATIITDPIT